MIWIYRFLFPLGFLAFGPRYLARMRRRGYREGFRHRFGFLPPIPPRRAGTPRIWLQAVSVGEMLAIEPVLRTLCGEGVEIVLTTTTSTGYRLAIERYRAWTAAIAYFPIDWPPFSGRAWRRIEPDLAIVTEGERWPEHLRQAARRGVSVVCINARLSDRSFRRLSRFRWASRLVLGGVARFLAGSAEDAARFRALGTPSERVSVTGNIKFDVAIPELDPGSRQRLREDLGLPETGAILLGSSTWPGEEAALLEGLRFARGQGIACSLLLVPRHAERRAEIERLLGGSGLRFHFRSRGTAPGEVDVAVADTTGELRALTQLATLVVVGKSLPPHTEGQTPVEAAALGRPLLFGPGMGNFRAIARDLLARGAALQIPSVAALPALAAELLRDTDRREALAAAAAKWHRDNAGAVERTLAIVRSELGHRGGAALRGLKAAKASPGPVGDANRRPAERWHRRWQHSG